MTIRWFTDADRQAMRDAAEETRVYWELVERYTVYREADRTPITPGQMDILNGLRRIDPRKRR